MALGLALVGCGGSDGGDDDDMQVPPVTPVCEAGRVTSCPCADGTMGTQTCAKDGAEWGVCVCEVVDPVTMDPMVGCDPATIIDQTATPAQFRCGSARPIMYGDCDKPIRESGVCVQAPGGSGSYCCPR